MRRPSTARASLSLQRRITGGVLAYLLLATVVLLVHAEIVHERAERFVLRSLLQLELDQFEDRLRRDPGWRPADPGLVRLFVERSGEPMPAALWALQPGLHDDVFIDDVEHAVLVRGPAGGRLLLALDIDEFERTERVFAGWAVGISLLMVAVLATVVAWGVGRLVRPLRRIAGEIAALQPDAPDQRIAAPQPSSTELDVVAGALDSFLQRQNQLIERERAFVDSVSHELRTPVAVIVGACELALAAEMPTAARLQVQRVLRTARNVEQLVQMLLLLARDPGRLAGEGDRIALHRLLPEIADDHRHLCAGKDLEIMVEAPPQVEIVAPLAIVQAAVGNLLRNAIENSDSGTVRLRLSPQALVTIEDPGHGMSPEQISAIYARQARETWRGGGIGLDLIGRLCRHLGWQLQFASPGPRGTVATLDLSRARIPPG